MIIKFFKRFKIFNEVESNKVWMIKNNKYLDYIRIIGNMFFLVDENPI